MCEAHICDVIRTTFPDAKKVSASYRKAEAEFLSEEPADDAALKKAIDATGYRFISMRGVPEEKRGLFFRK